MDFLQTVCALILWRSGLGLLMDKFLQLFIDLPSTSVFLIPDYNLSKCQWNFTKLGMCIDIVEICLGLLMGKPVSF